MNRRLVAQLDGDTGAFVVKRPKDNTGAPKLPRWEEKPVPEHEVRHAVREMLRQSKYEVMDLFQKGRLPEPLDGHVNEDEYEQREIDALWGDRLHHEYRPAKEEALRLKKLLEEDNG